MVQSLFLNVIIVTLTTSVTITALLLLLPVINKNYTAKWRYWVWLILAVRLLIPFSPSLPQAPIEIVLPVQGIEWRLPVQNTASPVQISQETAARTADTDLSADPRIEDNGEDAGLPAGPPAAEAGLPAAPYTAQTDPAAVRTVTLNEILSVIWILGIIIFLMYHFTGYIFFGKTVRRFSRPVEDTQTCELWSEVKKEMNISRSIRLVICKKVQSPMMSGFFKPVLILPDSVYNGAGLKIILKHELIHYKRKDIWYKLLLVCVGAVHWFNPLVHLMAAISVKDIEMVCDSEMIKGSGAAFRKQYSETILSAIHMGNQSKTVFSTYFNGGKRTMKERFENIFDTGKKRSGIIALFIIIAAAGIAASSVAYGAGSGGTEKAIDNIALLNGGNSYSLDASGNVIISYRSGAKQSQAPLKLYPDGSNFESGMEEGQTGFYLSEEKTAIVYGGFNGEPVRVLLSGDMGETWSTCTVTEKPRGSAKFVQFLTKNDGWIVLSSFHGMGSEEHFIYKTSNGGRTWKEVAGNANEVYARVLTGMGFSEKNTGFLCFRYEFTDFEPAICRTLDGGKAWEKLTVSLPEQYAEYQKTPLSPAFTGAEGLLPIRLSKEGADDVIGTVYLESSDYGKTWTFDEKYNMAMIWADAWKTRDGRLRYAVMGDRLQTEFRAQQLSPDNFVIRWSSPWVQRFDVTMDGEQAVVTYWYMDSTASTYKGVERLTFGRENGRMAVLDCKTEIDLEEYVDTSDWKSVDAGVYTFSIPWNWQARLFSGSSVSFAIADEEIGMLTALDYDPSRPLSQFEGNHRETLSTETLKDCKYPASKVMLRRSQQAASGDGSYIDEMHIYLIPENSEFAYDLRFISSWVDKKAVEIAKSMTIHQNRVQIEELALTWAKAVRDRDGRAQYDLLSSRLQKDVRGDYESGGWVTGQPSPWIDGFTVVPGDKTAEVAYTYMTSEGFAGEYRQTLSFTEENGRLAISGYTEPKQASGRSDGVVIAWLEEKNIWLSADTLKDGMFSGMTLSIDGKTKRFPWKTYGEMAFLPEISYADVDGDNRDELIVILCKGEGTGVLVEEIHVINPENFSEIAVQDPLDALEKRVVSGIDDSGVKIAIDNQEALVFAEEEIASRAAERTNWFDNLGTGSIVDYSVKSAGRGSCITVEVGAQLTPAAFLGSYNVIYRYEGDQLKAGEISFFSFFEGL